MSKYLSVILLGIWGMLPCAPSLSSAQTDAPFAVATPLKGIVIDGKLDDWPAGLEKHWILHSGQVYGPTDIDDADLKTSADLSPSFRVGYSPEENLIYIGVTVRDDVEMTGKGGGGTDRIEVYVEGRRERKTVATNNADVSALAALQYALSPTTDSNDPSKAGQPALKNPRMFSGDITKTRTRAAYSRQGDISCYEFAIEAYNRFPEAPTKLFPGKLIGLDVVCNDLDSTGTIAWVCWGPFKPFKFFNADTLGDVLLVDETGSVGAVTGMVTARVENTPLKGYDFGVYRGEEMLGSFRTDDAGKYRMNLISGKYTIKPFPKQGLLAEAAGNISIKPGGESITNLAPKPMALPQILSRSAVAYRAITGYRDSTIISIRGNTAEGMKDVRHSFVLAFARPNKLRFEFLGQADSEAFSPFSVLSQYSDGAEITAYLVNMKRFIREKAPNTLDISTVDAPVWQAMGSMLDLLFLMNENPVLALIKNAESIREIGKSVLAGESVTGLEIIKAGDTFLCMSQKPGPTAFMPKSGALDTLTIWFGDRDALIRKVSFRLVINTLEQRMPEQLQKMFRGTFDVEMRHKNMELNPVFTENDFVFEKPADAMEIQMPTGPILSTAPKKKELAGKPAPEFTLKNVDGKETNLSGCRDRVVVLTFWASLNEPSVQTLELAQKIHRQFEGKNVRVIGINEFEDESPDSFRSFLKEHGITHCILKDAEGTMTEKYGFTKIPACFVIDKKGIVRQSYNEKPDGAELTALVTRLLNE